MVSIPHYIFTLQKKTQCPILNLLWLYCAVHCQICTSDKGEWSSNFYNVVIKLHFGLWDISTTTVYFIFILVLSLTLNRMWDNHFIFQNVTALPSVSKTFLSTITNEIRKTFCPNQISLFYDYLHSHSSQEYFHS